MLLRNVNERLQIISRKSCKNELTYNQKLFKVRVEYMQKYKSVILIGTKEPFNSEPFNSEPLKSPLIQNP